MTFVYNKRYTLETASLDMLSTEFNSLKKNHQHKFEYLQSNGVTLVVAYLTTTIICKVDPLFL